MGFEHHTGKILLVDDDHVARAMVRDVAAQSEVELEAVGSVKEALRSLRDSQFDVVILDVNDSIERLRPVSLAAERIGAVLIATGDADGSQLRAGMQLGARDFLDKPYSDVETVTETLLRGVSLRRQNRVLDSSMHGDTAVAKLAAETRELRMQLDHQVKAFESSRETSYLDLSRMMTIISNIMDGIVFVDREDCVMLINPVAEDFLGIKAFLAIGRPVQEIAKDSGEELLSALVSDHLRVKEGDDFSRTIELHHSEHDLLYIKINTSRVLDYKGEFAGVLTVLQDITSEYKSDQLKNQYLSIVAHELRTPLTGIKTFSTLMAKGSLGPLSEHQDRAVRSIREQSIRLEHQIDKLINLGNIDSNDYAQDPEVLSVVDLVAGAVAPFEQVASDSEVELFVNASGVTGQAIRADRTDIKRALKSLVENAVKFTPDGGSVSIAAEVSDDMVEFTVEDCGIGINPRYHRRIFEKFFQVEDPLTRHHGGAGLGLFVAQGIIEAHGSKIEVSSELGSGAVFRFSLPVIEIESGDAAETECVTASN